MKSRNIKTRLAAFGLALLMGLSPLGNLADVHAAETKNPSEPVTESVEISETEQTEEASEAAKHLVTAEDITKDISDKDFMAETCMEGIHYNPEQEDVTLERIEAEDGGSYHPDQAGTYIATYWVVPKDARDSYSVSRKIDPDGYGRTGPCRRKRWAETERGYEIRRRFGDACAGDHGGGSNGIRGRCRCTGSKGTGRKD